MYEVQTRDHKGNWVFAARYKFFENAKNFARRSGQARIINCENGLEVWS